MQKSYDYTLKYVIVGSSSVGKSSILRRFADDEFEQSYLSTIGIDFRFKSMYIDENYVKLQIWDTAGQQKFRGITKSYYKGANAIIIVYDVTSQESFEDVMGYWLDQCREYTPEDRIFCLISKCDEGELTEVPPEQIVFLQENGIRWFKVSAKQKFNVSEAVLEITREVMKKQKKNVTQDGLIMGIGDTPRRVERKAYCCFDS